MAVVEQEITRQRVMGIFQDEPLMEALMERVREDRRAEMEAEAMD